MNPCPECNRYLGSAGHREGCSKSGLSPVRSDDLFCFGEYAIIEQKRYGVKNEMYIHKVIGTLSSNSYVDVPVQSPATETLHSKVVPVVACVCCGVDERTILHYRQSDIMKQNAREQAQR